MGTATNSPSVMALEKNLSLKRIGWLYPIFSRPSLPTAGCQASRSIGFEDILHESKHPLPRCSRTSNPACRAFALRAKHYSSDGASVIRYPVMVKEKPHTGSQPRCAQLKSQATSTRRRTRLRCLVGIGLLASATAVATAQFVDLVPRVRQLALAGDLVAARQLIDGTRATEGNQTSQWLAAASWLARGASFLGEWGLAEKYAREALAGSAPRAGVQQLDADTNLSTALGASIEVLGKAYDARGDRTAAVRFLNEQREKYVGTSIETRIQKNLLLLSLRGNPLPELDMSEHLLNRSAAPGDMNGKVLLLYFWAHWCSDCKRQESVLELLHNKYSDDGLSFIGPTKLYGYTAQGREATPSEELDYLRSAYQKNYPTPPWMPAPVSRQNFLRFGVSSTPTLVLVDRNGIVRLYHPGYLGYSELEEHIEPLLSDPDN